MKKLDKTWINCLKMWEWITTHLPNGFSKASEEVKDFIIARLKQDWLKNNKFRRNIRQDCFLCEYDMEYEGNCENCPAVLAHPKRRFHCTDTKYNYAYEPIKFYEELMDRNARRKGD